MTLTFQKNQLREIESSFSGEPGTLRKSKKGDTMKSARMIIQVLTLMIFAILVLPPGIPAQEYFVETEQEDVFKKEELAQMLAPIALYPDSLITQMLMASTYPLEVVKAERWLRQNKDLKGDELNDALHQVGNRCGG